MCGIWSPQQRLNLGLGLPIWIVSPSDPITPVVSSWSESTRLNKSRSAPLTLDSLLLTRWKHLNRVSLRATTQGSSFPPSGHCHKTAWFGSGSHLAVVENYMIKKAKSSVYMEAGLGCFQKGCVLCSKRIKPSFWRPLRVSSPGVVNLSF